MKHRAESALQWLTGASRCPSLVRALNWPGQNPHGGPEDHQAWLNHSNLSFQLHFLRDSTQLQATLPRDLHPQHDWAMVPVPEDNSGPGAKAMGLGGHTSLTQAFTSP